VEPAYTLRLQSAERSDNLVLLGQYLDLVLVCTFLVCACVMIDSVCHWRTNLNHDKMTVSSSCAMGNSCSEEVSAQELEIAQVALAAAFCLQDVYIA
jgi:hypothetical protein